MTRNRADILIRGVSAVAILGCSLYCAFGVVAAIASDQRGTAIHHYEPISLGMLWQEVSKVSYRTVAVWFSELDSTWPSMALSAVFLLATFALALAVNPRILYRSRRAVVIPALGFGMGLLFVFGFLGLWNLVFTFLNAFVLRGLDGEWINEFGPVYDSMGILYLIASLLFGRSLVKGAGIPADSATR